MLPKSLVKITLKAFEKFTFIIHLIYNIGLPPNVADTKK